VANSSKKIRNFTKDETFVQTPLPGRLNHEENSQLVTSFSAEQIESLSQHRMMTMAFYTCRDSRIETNLWMKSD